jgi:ketosteroid isomerase-like protein
MNGTASYARVFRAYSFLVTCCIPFLLSAQSEYPIPEYTPDDPELHAVIATMDSIYFHAYNTCDMETQREMYAEDIEFYHDLAGLATDKEMILKALEENICGKVTRHIVPGTLEVYPIPGHGAFAMGYHRFENKQEPDAPSIPSRFMAVWKNNEGNWQLSRVISLH